MYLLGSGLNFVRVHSFPRPAAETTTFNRLQLFVCSFQNPDLFQDKKQLHGLLSRNSYRRASVPIVCLTSTEGDPAYASIIGLPKGGRSEYAVDLKRKLRSVHSKIREVLEGVDSLHLASGYHAISQEFLSWASAAGLCPTKTSFTGPTMTGGLLFRAKVGRSIKSILLLHPEPSFASEDSHGWSWLTTPQIPAVRPGNT